MSWKQPEPADTELVNAFAADPGNADLLRLAESLSPALRAEPALVRAARLAFLPASTVDVEGDLQFSELAASAGSRELVFAPGIARALANRLAAEPARLAASRALVAQHSRHWHRLDRLGQALHLAVFDDDRDALRANLRSALRVVVEAGDDDARVETAAWLRATLPGYADALSGLPEYGWLLRYAALVTDDGGGFISRAAAGEAAMPAWLVARAPEHGSTSVSLRWYPGWLAGGPPGHGDHDIPLPGDVPSPVRLGFPDLVGRAPRMVPLGPSSLIELPAGVDQLELETLTGERFALRADSATGALAGSDGAASDRRVRLLYAPEDHDAARRALALLAERGIDARPAPVAAEGDLLPADLNEGDDPPVVVRLWSRAAQASAPSAGREGWRGLLLRLDDTPVPGGSAEVPVLDLPGLRDAVSDSEQAALAEALDRLLAGGEAPRGSEPETAEESAEPGTRLDAVLVHAAADRERAQALAERLASLGLEVRAFEEIASASGDEAHLALRALRAASVLVPLISRATGEAFGAAELHGSAPTDDGRARPLVTVARLDDVPLPEGWGNRTSFDVFEPAETERAVRRLAERLHLLATLDHDQSEIVGLLEELDDPVTEPPRRLEIGDRLDDLGDPRPGVGVVEIEVDDEPATREPEAETTEPAADTAQAAPATAPPYPPEIRRLLDELAAPATEPPRRLQIGDELERRGDPRPGVGLREDGPPDIAWVEVPGGPFVWQQGETRELPAFWLARYPVTNAQYQAFVDDGGYEEARWWTGLEKPDLQPSKWPQGNRPRTNVSWHEAVAFCRWLSARLVGDESAIRLPTELEWEKAARGEKGLAYPWGEEYRSGFANLDEKNSGAGPWYLEQTTAVGVYPHGRSPYGIHDLAGTVWEWCLNKYDDVEDVAIDGSAAARALRGGSWSFYPRYARAGFRDRFVPRSRVDDRGFRVLSSVPI